SKSETQGRGNRFHGDGLLVSGHRAEGGRRTLHPDSSTIRSCLLLSPSATWQAERDVDGPSAPLLCVPALRRVCLCESCRDESNPLPPHSNPRPLIWGCAASLIGQVGVS